MLSSEQRSEILDILENDARTAPEEIALMLGADAAQVAEEIARLEEEKIIVKYTAVVNRAKIGSGEDVVEALIEVKVTPQRDYGYDDMARRIYKYEEVQAVYLMAGSYDLVVRLKARSMKAISKFVFEKLAVMDGIASTVTIFMMRKYKESGVILVDDEADERLVVTA